MSTEERKFGNRQTMTEAVASAVVGQSFDNGKFATALAANSMVCWFSRGEHPIAFQVVEPGKGYWRYWNGSYWARYNHATLERDLSWVFDSVTAKQIRETVATMAIKLAEPFDWWDKKPVVVFENCVLEVRDKKVRKYEQGFRADDKITRYVPVSLAETPTPKWDAMLATVLPNEEDRMALQELFGYVFFPAVQLQVFHTLVGDAGTGKGTILRVLKEMLGDGKVTYKPMTTLHETHATAGLVDSLVNIDLEAEFDRKGELVLKALTGGGETDVNQKYMPTYSTILPTKFIMAANELPRFSDRTDGTWSRCVYLPFETPIPPEQRRPMEEVIEELQSEFGGILLWGLQGLNRVLPRGTRANAFTQSERAKELLAEHRIFSDSFRAWFEEQIEFAEDCGLRKDLAFERYKDWCRVNGCKPLSSIPFGKLMLKQGVGKSRPREQGRRVRCYTGIQLRREVEYAV